VQVQYLESVTYWHTIGSRWEFQATGIAGGSKVRTFASVGLKFNYLLSNAPQSYGQRFYIPLGVALLHTTKDEERSARILTGTGIGLHLYGTNSAFVSLELPFTLILKLKKDSVAFDGAYPIPGLSLVFYI